MSPPGRPKGEYRRAQHEGSPASPPGRPKGEYRRAQHEGSPAGPRAAHARRSRLRLALFSALGVLGLPAMAGNPFVDRPAETTKVAQAPSGAGSRASAGMTPVATNSADNTPSRMPPGAPSQLGGNLPMSGGPISNGSDSSSPKNNASRDNLDNLAISSIIGQKVLFRVARSGNSNTSVTGQSMNASSSYSSVNNANGSNMAGQAQQSVASGNAQSFTLLRAFDRKPFLLGQDLYVAVVEGFTVTLYRAADRELRTPVWVGEPAPAPNVVLNANVNEFSAPPQPVPNANTTPPSVLPSAAFSGTLGSNGNSNSGNSNNSGSNSNNSNGGLR